MIFNKFGRSYKVIAQAEAPFREGCGCTGYLACQELQQYYGAHEYVGDTEENESGRKYFSV